MNTAFTYTSAQEALSKLQSNQRIFIHGSGCTPLYLLRELASRSAELKNVELVSISLQGDVEVCNEKYAGSFHTNSLFVSAPVRKHVNEGHGDYVPVFLSEIPELFKHNILKLDAAIIHVSPPDTYGYCSLGVSVDIARTAVNHAPYVIAQVNHQMPRTHGDSFIHVSRIHAMVEVNDPLPEVLYSDKVSETELKVGEHVAELIEDRSTLQMGIGTIPDAVLAKLNNHKDLGIHSEMFSDGLIPLLENGTITNAYKTKHPGKVVTAFALGTKKLYQYVNDNPLFAFLDVDYVNEPHVIRQNKKVCAVNSCIEMDLTGQTCSDSIGTYQYSGVGGQMDFMRGAALSEGGKPIMALTARTGKRIPRIVPFLKTGAGVVTTRAHMHYVATEYGTVDLFGKNLRQRAKALISIAHPDDREMLEKAAFDRFKIF